MVSLRRMRRPKRGTCPVPRHVRKEDMRQPSFIRLNASLLLLCAGVVAAQEKSEPGAQILRQEIKWTEAYKQRNINILSSLLADDFVITIEDGSTYSKAGYITHSADVSVHVEVAELSDLKVRMHGNTAVVTGACHERGESNGKRYEYRDRLTDVWMKVGNTWPGRCLHPTTAFR
jgi:ketosteroid isomerase-like protein